MAKFLFEASYTVEGLQGLRRGGRRGRGRRRSAGGRLERFDFAFGDHDAFVIADLPDNQSAAAVALAVSAAGGASVRTVVLLTPEEVDAARKRSIDYQPPEEWEEPRHFRRPPPHHRGTRTGGFTASCVNAGADGGVSVWSNAG